MKSKLIFAAAFTFVMLNLTSAQVKESNVLVEQLAKSTVSWNGADLPEYPSGKPEITILKISIPPGVKLPEHEHPFINAGVLLKGELTVVTKNNLKLHLKAGDSLIELVNTFHYGMNEGKETAEIIVFYAGIKGEPITVKK